MWKQIISYAALLLVLFKGLLPKLIEALTWDQDTPEYGRWFSSEYYDG